MRARILHETLPLARAMEERFGKGSYAKIMSANEENAYIIQGQLMVG